MQNFPWLSLLIAVPLVGAIVLAFAPTRANAKLSKQIALAVSGVTLVLAVIMAAGFDKSLGYNFTEDHVWIRSFGAHYALGVDGLGLTLVVLTALLTPLVILAGWDDGDDGRWGTATFFAWILGLEAMAIGVFAATDVFLFYVFFEATLIPVYFLVAGWGGPNRGKAAVKFLIYSLLGGLIMLASVIGLYVESAKDGAPSYLVADLAKLDISTTTGRWLFLGFFIAFAIKAPMFPVHTWLPDTTEAATPGTSVLLVSVLDKIGTFGMVRFCLGLFPEASRWATPVVVGLALFSILYGAFVAIGQRSMSRLIAFSSVSHFGFIVLGIFVMNSQGQTGANFYMFNHGLSTAALFLVTGFLIKRGGSRDIDAYGGVEKVAPYLAGFLLIACLSSASLPGLAPFVSEILVLIGAFVFHWWVAAIAVPAIVLGAFYVLWMYQRTMTGPENEKTSHFADLNLREVAAVAPLLVLIVVLGFWPKPVLSVLHPTVRDTLSHVHKADPAPAVSSASEGSDK